MSTLGLEFVHMDQISRMGLCLSMNARPYKKDVVFRDRVFLEKNGLCVRSYHCSRPCLSTFRRVSGDSFVLGAEGGWNRQGEGERFGYHLCAGHLTLRTFVPVS